MALSDRALRRRQDVPTAETIEAYSQTEKRIKALTALIGERSREATRLEPEGGMEAIKRAAELSASVCLFQYELDQSRSLNNARRIHVEELGRDHFFPNKEHAMKELLERYSSSG